MILVDIPPSTTFIIIGMLERWDAYQVSTKASAKKRKKEKKAGHEVRWVCCSNASMGERKKK